MIYLTAQIFSSSIEIACEEDTHAEIVDSLIDLGASLAPSNKAKYYNKKTKVYLTDLEDLNYYLKCATR